MKIGLFGTYNTSNTGPSRVTAGLAQGLARLGHEVVLFAHGDRIEPPHADVHMEHLGPTPDSVLGMVKLTPEIAALADEHDCDIVHPLEEYGYSTPIRTVQWTSGIYQRRQRAPRDFAGYQALSGDLILNAMNRIGSSLTDITVAQSPETARQMRRYWRLVPDEIIPLGIDEDLLTPPLTAGDETRILVPGRISQIKGQKDLLDHLDSQGEYTVDIIGSVADEEYYADLSSWHHRFHGFVTGAQLNEFYEKADIVVVPSRHETFSMTALEGLAHGAVIIITRQCGFAQFDWATPKNGIYVVENGAAAASMVKSLSGQDLSSAQQAAYKLATSLTWTNIAERYERLYHEVVSP